MALLLTLWLSLFPPDGTHLAHLYHYDLTPSQASEHIATARVAAALTGTDYGVLLYIAWHESRFRSGTVTPEPGGKVSCGVMTPVPQRSCPRRASLLDQYRAGGAHLAWWYRVCEGNAYCALTGYAGGFALIRACRRGPVMVREGVDACGTAWLYMNGARRMRRIT